jgi:hypothetical protein
MNNSALLLKNQLTPQKKGAARRGTSASVLARGAPLGIYTEYSAASNKINDLHVYENGELKKYVHIKGNKYKRYYTYKEKRRKKYKLLKRGKKLLPNERISSCSQYISKNIDEVTIVKDEKGHHHYHGIAMCGSVWACPVCASKVAETRCIELNAAMQRHQEKGGINLLITLTFPHKRFDNLSGLLKKQAYALRLFRSSRAWKRIKEENDLIGFVRALEVTHGVNGWHPHTHEIWFVTRNIDIQRLETQLFQRWRSCCIKAGLGIPTREHGVTVKNGQHSQNYVTKWGADREITYSHIKEGKRDARTPWDLLNDYSEGDEQAGILFKEFYYAFKGKRQLFWSKNLKSRFNIDDIDDLTLAERPPRKSEKVYTVSYSDWYVIVKLDLQVDVLESAELYGVAGIEDILAKARNELKNKKMFYYTFYDDKRCLGNEY